MAMLRGLSKDLSMTPAIALRKSAAIPAWVTPGRDHSRVHARSPDTPRADPAAIVSGWLPLRGGSYD
ncbi:Hypothetical protein MexAM1_META1p2813 [Methylorubrum extorquens AM1]|uniref:Uncharacterized protein n=1 Tax=Methylorubrum extorquens (strain ATCC 14718 / DSM 1338 / JCM 2805 / NCIMB 9133 / AM1) TaxID=272630 RepID=C5ATP2_METEA|nr:Hypothetical protein MexAM1_META1p2813 [Methylorubrum extorquens AM1]